MFELLKVIPKETVNETHLNRLYKVLDNITFYDYNLCFSKRYVPLNKTIFLNILKLLWKNYSLKNIHFHIYAANYILEHKDIVMQNQKLFADILFYHQDRYDHVLHDDDWNKLFDLLSSYNINFLKNWVNRNTQKWYRSTYKFKIDKFNLNQLWGDPDYEKKLLFVCSLFLDKKYDTLNKHPIYRILQNNKGLPLNEKRVYILSKLINKYCNNKYAMKRIFNSIIKIYPVKERIPFVSEFLKLNNDSDFFKELDFSMECTFSVDASNSSYLSRIDFWKTLQSELLNMGNDYLGIRAYISDEIDRLNRSLVSNEKFEFMRGLDLG